MEILKSISLEDLKRFFADYIKKTGPKRRKISVQVFGSSHIEALRELEGKDNHGKVIADIYAFKREQSLYGSFKGRSMSLL